VRCWRLDLRDLDEYLVPIDGHARNSSDLCFPLELEKARASVTSRFELVNSQCAIDGMYEPDFANAGALVSGKLDDLVVGPSGRLMLAHGCPPAAIFGLERISSRAWPRRQ